MEYSFAIGIPTINRSDLLNPTLEKYFKDFEDIDIHIIDNGNQSITSRENNFYLYRPGENYGVAKSWNFLCSKIFQDHDYALILNDDVYLGSDQYQIDGLARGKCVDLLRCETQYHLSAFILSKSCFNDFKFDESFYPAYFEDKDYMYRLQLADRQIEQISILNPQKFINSASISKEGGNPSINKNFTNLAQFYMKKWGGPPGLERYKLPFTKGD